MPHCRCHICCSVTLLRNELRAIRAAVERLAGEPEFEAAAVETAARRRWRRKAA